MNTTLFRYRTGKHRNGLWRTTRHLTPRGWLAVVGTILSVSIAATAVLAQGVLL